MWVLSALLFEIGHVFWIDVCPTNANLVATSSADKIIKIFDKRSSEIVKTFQNIHSGKCITSINLIIIADGINFVRWSPNGTMLASTSTDRCVYVTDFASGWITHKSLSREGSNKSFKFSFLIFIGRYYYVSLLPLNKREMRENAEQL